MSTIIITVSTVVSCRQKASQVATNCRRGELAVVGRDSLQTFWNFQNAQAMTAPPISEAKEIAS